MTCELTYEDFKRAPGFEAHDLIARVREDDGSDRGMWTLRVSGTILDLIHPEDGAAPPSVVRALGERLGRYAHLALQEDEGPDEARYFVVNDRDGEWVKERAKDLSSGPLTDDEVLATFDR